MINKENQRFSRYVDYDNDIETYIKDYFGD